VIDFIQPCVSCFTAVSICETAGRVFDSFGILIWAREDSRPTDYGLPSAA
jgi:hypothetical protein